MRNYRHIIRSVKYYPRKHIETSNAENNITVTQPTPKPKPIPDTHNIKIENKIVREVANKALDDFESEYQAFIADLKAKKEKELKAKEEAEKINKDDNFEAEYQAFIEELKTMKENHATSTEETIIQD